MVPLPMVNVDYRREKRAKVQMGNRPRLSSVLILLPPGVPMMCTVTCHVSPPQVGAGIIFDLCCVLYYLTISGLHCTFRLKAWPELKGFNKTQAGILSKCPKRICHLLSLYKRVTWPLDGSVARMKD